MTVIEDTISVKGQGEIAVQITDRGVQLGGADPHLIAKFPKSFIEVLF